MANLQDKRGTAAALAAANPTPLEGEVLYETDTRKFKVGDGSAAYTSLSYVGLSSIATANGVSAAVALGVATISLGAITPSSVTVSGVITCSAGSAALPSITTTGDTNTGIWFPAADTVAISTGGVERFRIDSAGNITGTTLSGTNTGDQTAASLGLVIGTNVQAYDAGLLSIAAATTAADRFLYTTALDVYAVATITTFGRSLVDDADASTARTTLGLVIGTNVQAYDAGLLSIAAATTAADRFLYTTALDVYAVATITTFGRSLVDDADAATARTTLGLGTISTQASSAVAITGGTINGATIGATTAATGAFTTVTHSAGTALLPSITTSGDTNTGIWFPTADTVGVSTGGVDRVRIDSSGNIGLGVRLSGGATSQYHLGTQAGLGLSIYHAAKGGQIDTYQPRRHLSAYTYSSVATQYGIMRIRIPAISGGGHRLTIKHTGQTSPIYSRSWEINCADYYGGNGIFGTNSISVEGAPDFSRIRLMENTSETIWNSLATRYLILGQIIDGIGTVSNTAVSATVTGSGTKFTHLFKVGDGIFINSLWNYITAIASDTSLTVSATITLANTAVVYSRGDVFVSSQMTIDLDQMHAGGTLQINTAFGIDCADTEATLSLAAGVGRDITLNNTNAQHGFVGIGTQSPSNLLHVAQQKLGRGTVSNSAAGTVITGVNTTFLDTFKVGDSITVPHIGGSTGTPQTVVISAIASNTSMTVAAITNANAAGSRYSLAGGTLFSVAGNGTITTSSGNTLSGTNTGDQTAASLGLVIGTNVQAYDAGLLSIAAATTAADSFLYTTALDVYAVGTITTFGRSLVDDADASTARTTLGLVIGTNVQAYDAGLLSIAAATTAADSFLYTTALDVYAVGTITTFGRSLVDDADAATARTTLGLVIGTNVQAYDAGLLSIAAATTAADRFLYTTALDVYAVGTITTFGRSLVDDADAATARTTLGLVIGTNVAPVASPTFTGVVTTAGQIAFPATVNLSAGANTLDDYEEGTWTPTFTATTTNPTVHYYAPICYGIYVKIGKTVFISGSVSIDVLTSAGSGNLQISGLPFTASSGTTGGYGSLAIGYKSAWTTTTPGTAYVQASAAYIALGNEAMTATITTANLSATSYIQFSGFYNTTS